MLMIEGGGRWTVPKLLLCQCLLVWMSVWADSVDFPSLEPVLRYD